MPALVVDSSIVSAWCFPDERTPYTHAILQALGSTIEAAAPRVLAYELRNSLLMGVRRRRISHAHAMNALGTVRQLPIHLTDPVSYDHIFTLAVRHGLTYYDAAYLDLALREALPLASLDEALCTAARASDIPLFRP